MTQDYFMRLIDQVAVMLARIVGLRAAGDNSGAQEELDVQCRQAIGLDISRLQQMSPEALSGLLRTSGGLRPSRAILLAELLLKDAEMQENDPSRAAVDYLHAFCLISDTIESLDADDQRDYHPKMQFLLGKLRPSQSDPYIADKLKEYESRQTPS
jgi:hypothetical protein